jgi:glycosyltransferase involved in cell wall biosynthesis
MVVEALDAGDIDATVQQPDHKMNSTAAIKIALVGSRIGYINRGFESFTRNLFERVKGDIDITLFKGAGPSAPGEVVVPAFRIEQGLLSRLGLSFRLREKLQERSFALGMLPWLICQHYDAIHFSEVMIGRALLHLRRVFGFKYKLIFSNGAPAPPEFYECFDITQEVTGVRYDEAVAYGISPDRLRLVPYGIDCDRFSPVSTARRNQLRAKYSIPQERFVVVCAAAIKRHHKRIDALIKEVSLLDPQRRFLLVSGHRTDETAELEAIARKKLGANCKFITVPHEDMHEVYQLSDAFALASLTEGLGIVILEAMSVGLPVVVHNAPSFRWVVQSQECTVDLNQDGSMAQVLKRFEEDPCYRSALGERLAAQSKARFDWSTLRADYLRLYSDSVNLHTNDIGS